MTDSLLERLDLALADSPDADADLLALVHDVRAEAPQMDPTFAAALDTRVADGFAGASRVKRPGWKWPRIPSLYVLGPAGAVAAAVVVVVVGMSGGSKTATPPPHSIAFAPQTIAEKAPSLKTAAPTSSGDAGAAPKVPEADSAVPDASSGTAAPITPQSQDLTTTAAHAPGRRVELTTQMVLSTLTASVQSVADGVVGATRRAGGFVSSSQVQINGAQGGAAFTLRIPSGRVEQALTAFTHLARVSSMSQSTQDITGEFASTNTQLSRLQRQLGELLRLPQTPSRRAHVRAVKQAIVAQNTALTNLRHRADYVTVNLTIVGHAAHHHAVVHHHRGSGGFSVHKALKTAGRILEVGAGVLVIALAILIPLILLLAAAGFAARGLRRRERETALKAS